MPESIPSKESEISLREYLERAIKDAGTRGEVQVTSLEQHLTSMIEGLRREMQLIQQSAQMSVDKAEEAQKLRNEAQNEWRGTMSDLVKRYAEQKSLDETAKALTAKIDATERAAELRLTERASSAEREMASKDLRLTEIEAWKNNMQGRLWAIPIGVGLIVFLLSQAMRLLFPAVPR